MNRLPSAWRHRSLAIDRRALAVALLVAIVVLLAACAPVGSPGASGAPGSAAVTPTPAAAIPLHPATPGANPLDLIATLFTPVFQVLFITLVLLSKVPGSNIAIAIVILTLLIRTALIPLYRRQLVNQKRMQLLAPELKELRRRYKDRNQRMAAEQEFYKQRGINPVAGGCLPLLLQLIFLIPIYSVFSAGLTNFNPQAMMNVFGIQLIDLHCAATPTIDAVTHHVKPCLDTIVFGVDWSQPEVFIGTAGALFSGLSILAIVSSLIQLVASRMTLPPVDQASDDPNMKIQRQTLLFVPLISLVYGSILPAGLFLYWIVGTIYQIVQQYLILGWGSMFPIFGWHPEVARNHTPRFPVAIPKPRVADGATPSALPRNEDRATSAAKTIRQRGRQGRRGRRR